MARRPRSGSAYAPSAGGRFQGEHRESPPTDAALTPFDRALHELGELLLGEERERRTQAAREAVDAANELIREYLTALRVIQQPSHRSLIHTLLTYWRSLLTYWRSLLTTPAAEHIDADFGLS